MARSRRKELRGKIEATAQNESAASRLRYAVVRGVQDGVRRLKAQAIRFSRQGVVFVGAEQMANVFHDEHSGPGNFRDLQKLPPQGSARIAVLFLIEQAEALAGRTADNDIGPGNVEVRGKRRKIEPPAMIAEISIV